MLHGRPHHHTHPVRCQQRVRTQRQQDVYVHSAEKGTGIFLWKINGDIMIAEMKLAPGRKMGWILHALLEEVLDDPKLNTREYLEKRTREMYELPDVEIQKLGEAGKDKKDETEFRAVKKLHRKHKVD